MKITGIKKAVSELKNAAFGRIYININTGKIEALSCISSTSGQLNDDELREVCTYNPRFDNLSVKWVKEQVEEFIHQNKI